ncbi:MAG: DUF4416 family protein [Thermogutta sp.]|uniref:DUF4416 family protein n=1 Tax=Thermogutta sp. TaxID=1962930 RepID=UPI0019B41E8F|nr:DUF4416 family protein [Thermogutta sp.]MBC7352253.1 DUF4416 family protein [Thermogutta sp.]
MGVPRAPDPVLLLVAVFSRYPEAIDWARQKVVEEWGPLALESPAFPFSHTDYYTSTMGPDLKKVFFAPADLIDPGRLPAIKIQTNSWEAEYAELRLFPEPRPLNIDPGYLTLGKLVLASTKDFTHRIYLGLGIYGEVTLFYRHQRWQHHEWTFADYRQPEYHEFFNRCRDYLHERLREVTSPCGGSSS